MDNLKFKKYKIVHLRDSSGLFGAERVILTLAKYIDKNKFDFSLLCLKGNAQDVEDLVMAAHDLGIEVQTIGVVGRFDIKAILSIRRYIKDNKVDIIHSHDFKSNLFALIAT